MNDDDDDLVNDDDLLIEAARYAIKNNHGRNNFMSRAKRAWYEAEAERRGAEWERAKIEQEKKKRPE